MQYRYDMGNSSQGPRLCIQLSVARMFTGAEPKCEKQMLDLNTNILFPCTLPPCPVMCLGKVIGGKRSIFTCSTKYRSTRPIKSRQSSLPFDFKTLWTLDEGSEKDNHMFKHSSIPKKVMGILDDFL